MDAGYAAMVLPLPLIPSLLLVLVLVLPGKSRVEAGGEAPKQLILLHGLHIKVTGPVSAYVMPGARWGWGWWASRHGSPEHPDFPRAPRRAS